jgi:hypothetical protein
LVRKPEGWRPLRRTIHRLEENTKMGLKEMGWEDMDWIHLAQDRDQRWAIVNTVMNFGFRKKHGIS